MQYGRYNFCPEEFTGWIEIPTKQPEGGNMNKKSGTEIPNFTGEHGWHEKKTVLLE